MDLKRFFKQAKEIGIATFKGFTEDRVMKLSAALAYYTILAMSPLLMVIISVASMLYEQQAIENQIYNELSELLGSELALEVQKFVLNSSLTGENTIALISGVVVMIIASTAVFMEIQDSLNFIWSVKAKPKRGWLKMIKNRVLSFSLIVSLSFILLVSMMLNAFVRSVGRYFFEFIMDYNEGMEFIFVVVNQIISLLISAVVFTLIFKILPDVKMKWKAAFIGGIFTTILFSLGQIGIGFYLDQFQPGLNFGSAGSIVAILVWVYYTAVIVYLGAEFTQVYAEKFSHGIQPSENAVYLKITEEEKNVSVLPKRHPEETEE